MHASVNIRHFFHKQWNNVTDPKFWKVYCRINVVRMLLECELVAYESNYLIFGETTRWGNPCAISTACVWLQRGSPPAAQNARSVFSSCRVIEEHIELASGPAGQVSKVMATLLSGHSSPVPSVIMHTHTHLSDRSSPPPDQTRTITVNISSHFQWAGNHKQTHQHSILLYIACSQKQTLKG